ncbi:MAG: hypothetical protein PHH77_13130 [Victivallaceae bacterium]|nr:hypothetical protein [Victivallaceae bacterium]
MKISAICKFKKNLRLLPVAAVLVITAGCAVNNNSLHVRDLADCMNLYGVKIDYVRPLEPSILYADSGMEMGISGHKVAAYYFNTDLETQRKRLERIRKNKYVYIMGLKFPAIVHGSCVLVNANSNPQKHKIIAAFEKFHVP